MVRQTLLLFFMFLVIIFSRYNYANENLELVFKNKIYDLVKAQYFKDISNNNKIYYSINEKKSLAACLDWNELTDFFVKNQNKYYKKIIWGSSYGENSSKNTSILNCQLRANNKKNCICQIIDIQNSNAINIPDYVLKKLNIDNLKDNNDKNKIVILDEQEELLLDLKDLLDEGLISEDDYTLKKK